MDNDSKKISGLSRTYEQYKKELRSFIRLYYPNILGDLNDASIGQVIIDLNASIGDNLSNYIDRAYQETQIDQTTTRRGLFAIARTRGLRIPGKKAALVEVEVSAEVPMDVNQMVDEKYLPVLRKGCQASSGGQTFELLYDCDFHNQFDRNGISNRIILPRRDSNHTLIGYTVKKKEIMSASITKFFKKVIDDSSLVPFMEVILPETNILDIDSIIFKEGTNFNYTPYLADFSIEDEFVDSGITVDGLPTWRFFEVESLLEDKIFLSSLKTVPGSSYPTLNVVTEQIQDSVTMGNTTYNYLQSVVKGEWKTIKQKFITEYTDKGYFKIVFGAGSDYEIPENPTAAQKQIARIVNNMNMGVLPKPGWTMWVQYRIGGGQSANISRGSLSNFSYKDFVIDGDGTNDSNDAFKKNNVYKSITVTNTSPSMGGKEAPTMEEIRYMIKYNSLAQNRCVTIKDYVERLNKMPGIYGVPFRTSVIEKNNKIYINVIGIDADGHVTETVSTTMIENISNYLSEYKSIGDYVVVKPGRVINLQVEADVMINRGFSDNDVVKDIINTISSFFDVNEHKMGENIFVSQLISQLLNVGGVRNLIDLRVYNIFNGAYSKSKINQSVVAGWFDENGAWQPAIESGTNRVQINLEDNDNILHSDSDSIFEIKSINNDIRIKVKRS
jgi:hypothetical protein